MRSVTTRARSSKRSAAKPVKKSQTPATDAKPAKVAQIWDTTRDPDGTWTGYLITGPSLNEVIAHVNFSSNEDPDVARKRLLDIAEKIARNPDAEYFGYRAIDLRECGDIGSTAEMPGWVYGLVCRPLGMTAREITSDHPRPFCRFRLAKMAMQYNRIIFPNVMKELAYHVVGLAEFPDATGCSSLNVVAAVDIPLDAEQVTDLIGTDPNDYDDERIQNRMRLAPPPATTRR